MPRGACRVLSGMHSRYPVQGVMPTEARPGRVVDGLVGDGLVRTAPEPLLAEKLRERPYYGPSLGILTAARPRGRQFEL